MTKPILYVEANPTNKKRLAFDFCYSAMIGAEQCGIKVKPFQYISEISNKPTNIVVGSVESCSMWLDINGYDVPQLPNIFPFSAILGRHVSVVPIENIYYPCFIKPYTQIKAFTGFVAENKLYVDIFSENYIGLVLAQEIIEITSEYRMYINCNKIVGFKHYRGDYLRFPNPQVVQDCVDLAMKIMDNHSYTLDFGVLEDGTTVLIEVNDGWACGNYGLDPIDYYYFIRNRWLQITGVRHRME